MTGLEKRVSVLEENSDKLSDQEERISVLEYRVQGNTDRITELRDMKVESHLKSLEHHFWNRGGLVFELARAGGFRDDVCCETKVRCIGLLWLLLLS